MTKFFPSWRVLLVSLSGLLTAPAFAQDLPATAAAAPLLTLPQAVAYALDHRPLLRQARLDEDVARAANRVATAAGLPQIGLTASGQHYLGLPFVIFPNSLTGISEPRQIGVRNISTVGFAGTQTLYSNDVHLARRSVRFNQLAAEQNTTDVRIAVVADVSKAFYDVLLAQRQVLVYEADLRRLQRNYQDARARYDAGIVDKTDFLQAQISLNNSRAGRKQAFEASNARTAALQELMGLPATPRPVLTYDTLALEAAAGADTLAPLDANGRIEIQRLQTQKELQHLNVDYYRRGFLPTVSAFGNYNSVYQNNNFGDLYNQRFPNSYVGLQLTLPLFTGFRRTQNLRRARLLDQRIEEDLTGTRQQLNTEYASALAAYKGNFNDYLIGKDNLELARQVYQVVDLQYREGIKAYIDLLVAQTTLRTAQLTYYTALFEVLKSKVDLERAQGRV